MSEVATVAEKFDYEQVSTAMNKVIEERDNARTVMNNITDILSNAISNTESTAQGETDRALGGNTKQIWELWNSFYESFDKFSASMNKMYSNVVAAQTTNKAFEAGTAGTLSSAVSATEEENS